MVNVSVQVLARLVMEMLLKGQTPFGRLAGERAISCGFLWEEGGHSWQRPLLSLGN